MHYDVGGIFFQQGCTDQPTYQKARDHFRQTKELLKKVFPPEIAYMKSQCRPGVKQFASKKVFSSQSFLYIFQLDSTVHVHLDEKRLAGYWNACKALTEDCDPSDSQTTSYDQINSLIRAHNDQVRADAAVTVKPKICFVKIHLGK